MMTISGGQHVVVGGGGGERTCMAGRYCHARHLKLYIYIYIYIYTYLNQDVHRSDLN